MENRCGNNYADIKLDRQQCAEFVTKDIEISFIDMKIKNYISPTFMAMEFFDISYRLIAYHSDNKASENQKQVCVLSFHINKKT